MMLEDKDYFISIGYVAGIIDGEGSIGLNMRYPPHMKRGTFRFDVEISSTDENLMKRLQEIFKGEIYNKKTYTKRPWRRPSYIMHLKRRTIEDWFPKIIPYLVIKKERAILLMEYFSLNSSQIFRKRDEDIKRCMEISKELKILNYRPSKEENLKDKRI